MPGNPPPPTDEIELVARDGDGGRRLDEFLAGALALGRRAAARVVERARVNGRRASKGLRLRVGDVVWLPREPASAPTSLASPDVVRSTSDVLVLAKPVGLPSVALSGAVGDSLAARIGAHYPECAHLGRPGEAGLVHRLDTGTSGLLLAARGEHAYERLRAQFRARTVRKEYLALVAGEIHAPVRITTPIGQHRGTRRRMRAIAPDVRAERYTRHPACTDVVPEHAVGGATLIRAATTSGARHQIRVHLASIGHPLLGDPIYGDPCAPTDGAGRAPQGFLLHACLVEWCDPATGERVVDRLATPAAWHEALARIAGGAARAR